MCVPTLRDIQLVELQIAREIKRICLKHNIKFFMSDGTLLGAVRHRGFIPWDDDMDFGMMLEDYQRFLQVAKEELSEEFFLQESITDSEYIMPYAKIRMNGTRIDETIALDRKMHKGIWVDIFPFVSISEKHAGSEFFYRKSQILMTAYLLKCGYDLNAVTKSKWKRFVKNLLKYAPIPKETLRSFVFTLLNEKNTSDSPYCMKVRGVIGKQFVFKKACFQEIVYLTFEGEQFPAPAMYDTVLRDEYGAYMQIPPETERKTHAAVNVEITPEILRKCREMPEARGATEASLV